MSTFTIEYIFDSWHPLCLCDSKGFPRKHTFKITPDALSKCHEFVVEFATFAAGSRNYCIKIKLNSLHGTIKSIDDVISVTLSHYYTNKCNDIEEIDENAMMWQIKIDAYEKEISDLKAYRKRITEQQDALSSDRNDNINEKVKELMREIESIDDAMYRTEYNETLHINSITLPYNTRGNLTNFAKDNSGTFWWYICNDTENHDSD